VLHASAKHPNSKLTHFHSRTAFSLHWCHGQASWTLNSLGSTPAPCFLVGSLPRCWLMGWLANSQDSDSLAHSRVSDSLLAIWAPCWFPWLLVGSQAHCQLTGCLAHFWLSGLSGLSAASLAPCWLPGSLPADWVPAWLIAGSLTNYPEYDSTREPGRHYIGSN